MRTCNYCAEEIKDEAKKCKHCGEWLDDSANPSAIATARGIFDKSSSFLKDTIDKTNEWRTRHLYVPTDDKPLELSGATFYAKHLVYNGGKHNYADILSIKFYAKVRNTNGINTDTETDFRIQFADKTLDLSRSSFFGIGSGRKTRQQMNFMQQVLKKLTFDIRLSKYIEQIEKQGYFSYGSRFKFYKNGDVEIDGEIADNICKAFKEKRLDWEGTQFSSVLGRIQFTDPYTIFIWKSPNSRSIFSSSDAISLYYDKDIVDLLVFKLIKDGSLDF